MAQGSVQKKNGSVRDLAAFAIKTKLAAKAGLGACERREYDWQLMNHGYPQCLTAEVIDRKTKRSVSVVQSASSHRTATSTRIETFFEIFDGER